MSRHEGVSCDSCMKDNFRGKRYKCLICYDYDLCSICYEAGASTTRHTADHPMQCILTKTDFDVFYGGEVLTAEQPQSYICPHCSKMGFSESSLQDHVRADHLDTSAEVVCPMCASVPGGDPNNVTDDFASHLTIDHRTARGDFDELSRLCHVWRVPHLGRGVSSSCMRRANMQHFGTTGSTLTSFSASSHENMDPIAELLSQLSSIRNCAAATQNVSSQLHQLEMQLLSTRHQLDCMPRRLAEQAKPPIASHLDSTHPEPVILPVIINKASSQFLLTKLCVEISCSELSANASECDTSQRNIFMQELLLSTLTEELSLVTGMDKNDSSSTFKSLPSPEPESEHHSMSSQKQTRKTPAEHIKQQNIQVADKAVGVAIERPNETQAARPVSAGAHQESSRNHIGGTLSSSTLYQVCGPVMVAIHCSNLGSSGGVSLVQGSASSAPHGGRERSLDAASAKRSMLQHIPSPCEVTDTDLSPH